MPAQRTANSALLVLLQPLLHASHGGNEANGLKGREEPPTPPETPRALSRLAGAWLSRELPSLVLVLVGLLVLVLHASRYMPFFADDSFISMRYAERLLEGKGLTWNDGERVEGYSNLLWVLLLAMLSAFGIDMVAAARGLGVACFGICMAAIVYEVRPRGFRDRRFLVGGIAVLALALTGTVAVWSIGGLEHPLLAALLASGSVLVLKNLQEPNISEARLGYRVWLAPAVLFGLACLTRPDAALFVGTVAGTLLVLPSPLRARHRPVLLLLGVALGFILAQLCFRLAYYGQWVPNTAHAKLAWTPQRVQEGLEHVTHGYAGLWPLLLLGSVGCAAWFTHPGVRSRHLVLLSGVLAWSGYLVVIGGDFFAAWRHFVPLVVLLALSASVGLNWLATRSSRQVWWPSFGVSVVLLGALLKLQLDDPRVNHAKHERWEWDAPPIASLLRRHFGDKAPWFAVDSAGCLPYFSKLPSIDMLGLNDKYLAHNRPKDMGTNHLGHELGNGYYVLSREPDLVLFGVPSDHGRPKFRGGWELFNSRTFKTTYDKVVFLTGPRRTYYRLWVSRKSAKVGIVRNAAKVVVPGYFFAASDATPAVERRGKLAVRLSGEHSVQQQLQLPRSGSWQVRLDASGGEVKVTPSGPGVRRKQRYEFHLREPGQVEVRLSAEGDEPAFVSSVNFEHVQ